jgi:hypothetical protein
MAMGATVSRIRIELIFRRCWNLVTPSPALQGASPDVGRISGRGLVGASGWHLDSPQAGPAPAASLESWRGIPNWVSVCFWLRTGWRPGRVGRGRR